MAVPAKPSFFSTLPPVYDPSAFGSNFDQRLQRYQSSGGPYFGQGWDALAGLSNQNVQGGQPVNPQNPFSTISNTKNTQVKSILDKILGNVDQAVGTDLNTNPYMLRKNTLDQGQEARAQGAASSLPGMQQAQQQSLAQWTNDYLKGINEARGYQQTEAGAIGQYYDAGPQGVQAQLNNLAKQRQLAVAAQTNRALDRIRGQANLQRMNLGDSSYLQAQSGATAADIARQEAISQADLGRQNYLTVKGAQADLAGRRQSQLDALNRMGLLPIEAQGQLTGQNLQQLGMAGDLIRSNNLYRTETPQDVLARQLGVLGQATQLDQANTFYGLNKPNEPDFSGYRVNPYYAGGIPSPQVYPQNYGAAPAVNYANAGFGSTQPNFSPQAANAYQRLAGVNPYQDPNFSPELASYAQQQFDAYYNAPRRPDTSPSYYPQSSEQDYQNALMDANGF